MHTCTRTHTHTHIHAHTRTNRRTNRRTQKHTHTQRKITMKTLSYLIDPAGANTTWRRRKRERERESMKENKESICREEEEDIQSIGGGGIKGQ